MSSKPYKLDNPIAVVGELAKRLHARYGDDVLPIFSEVMKEYGYHSGTKLAKRMPGLSFPDRVAGWLESLIRSGEADIVQKDDKRVVVKGHNCPLNLEGDNRTICEALMRFDTGLVGALADSPVALKIEKSLARGDDFCLVSFSRKRS
jgi:predicted ArsR family transcriptional regulator